MKKILILISLLFSLTLQAQLQPGFVSSQSVGGGFCAEYQTVYNAMATKPSATNAGYQNTMVKSLVDGGYWVKMAVFYCPATEVNTAGEALINWKNPGTYNLTNVSATTWTTQQGFTGDGSADYLSTNFNPSTDSSTYGKNDAHIAIYLRIDQNVATVAIGAVAGSDQITLFPRNSGSMSARLNAANAYGPTVARSDGYLMVCRSGENTIAAYRNGGALSATAVVSTVIPNDVVEILARGGATLSTNQFSIMSMGRSFSAADAAAINTIIETYMDAIGTGVE